VVDLQGVVEVAGFATKFLVSDFGVTIFAEFGALAASADQRDHGRNLSVWMRTLPL
jgi:hypothetical protein